MVHADAANLPSYIQSKPDLYDHLLNTLSSLIEPDTNWISAFSNASSVIYHTLNRYPTWLDDDKKINWAGFYLLSPLFPNQLYTNKPKLLLGPFVGLPACQLIYSIPGKGVCADASSLLPPRIVRVENTNQYKGHIACDSLSKSEIVIPLVINRNRLSKHDQEKLQQQQPSSVQLDLEKDNSWAGRGSDENIIIGVLDIDCQAFHGFDSQDEQGLQRIVDLIVQRVAW